MRPCVGGVAEQGQVGDEGRRAHAAGQVLDADGEHEETHVGSDRGLGGEHEVGEHLQDAAAEQAPQHAVARHDDAAQEHADQGGDDAEDLADRGDLAEREADPDVEGVGHDAGEGIAQLVEQDEDQDQQRGLDAIAGEELGEGVGDHVLEPRPEAGRRWRGLGLGLGLGLGRAQGDDEAGDQQHRHDRVDERPVEAAVHQEQRARPARDHAHAVAGLGRGRAGALLLGGQDLDAVGVDHHVLAGREEGDQQRAKRGDQRRLLGPGEPQDGDGRHEHELDEHHPGAAPAE